MQLALSLVSVFLLILFDLQYLFPTDVFRSVEIRRSRKPAPIYLPYSFQHNTNNTNNTCLEKVVGTAPKTSGSCELPNAKNAFASAFSLCKLHFGSASANGFTVIHLFRANCLQSHFPGGMKEGLRENYMNCCTSTT